MTYALEDIQIVDDAIKVIQRNPVLYGGEEPRGARLATGLVRDLLHSMQIPVSVNYVEGWWLLRCDNDWLRDSVIGGQDYWCKMIPTPSIATNSIRSEVIVRALSNNLFTVANGVMIWLVNEIALPQSIDSAVRDFMKITSSGRIVGFHLS